MPVIKDIAKEWHRNLGEFPLPELSYERPYDISSLKEYIPQEVVEVSQGGGVPVGLKDLRAGEAVLLIGCGAGLDCFEAARIVGKEGRVVGVEVADDLHAIARRNGPIVAKNLNLNPSVLEFKKGMAEDLPLEHEQFDLVISNHQINLSDKKAAVFEEIFRVLRPGGRFVISDIVSDVAVPQYIKTNVAKRGFYISGAVDIEQYLKLMRKAGFLGAEKLKFGAWKRIDGINFFSLTMRAFKRGQALIKSDDKLTRYAIFRGPFAKVKDELGNAYQRGQSKKISKEVFEILNLPGYRPHFILTNEAVDTISIESQLLFRKTDEKEVVWEGDYAILTSPFLMGEDDDRVSFYAGQPVEISTRAKEDFSGKSYSKFFVLLRRA